MEDFRIMSTVVAMVLGLGVTRLLLGFVAVFRMRLVMPADWLTLTWAGVVFAEMLEFWWAINQLPLLRDDFGFVDFAFLVGLTLSLFLAAALILPSRAEDETGTLRAFFERDGRYALAALTGFHVLAFAANVLYFDASPFAGWAALDVPIVLVPALVFLVRSRRVRAWLTLAYVPLVLIDFRIVLAS